LWRIAGLRARRFSFIGLGIAMAVLYTTSAGTVWASYCN
jgi:hypothetical protein